MGSREEGGMVNSGRRKRSTEILTILMERADVQGYLTTEDLMEIYPDLRGDVDYLDSIVMALRRRGVDILDGETPQGRFEEDEDESLLLSDFDPSYADLTPISSDDTIGLYLKEMSRVALLSIDEELDLARRIESGKQAKQELGCGRCPARRRQDLNLLIEDSMCAREHLIKANTRLVVSIAKRYIGRGVPFLDLIQEGNLGLMKACLL